jgi:hypothetical protein
MYPVLVDKSLVSCSLILWSWFILCFATAYLPICASLMYLLSIVYLSTFTRDAVYSYTRCSQTHSILDRWEVIGNFLRQEWDTFNVMFGQHSAKSPISFLHEWYVSR